MSVPHSLSVNVGTVVNQLMATFGTLADHFGVKKRLPCRVMILQPQKGKTVHVCGQICVNVCESVMS